MCVFPASCLGDLTSRKVYPGLTDTSQSVGESPRQWGFESVTVFFARSGSAGDKELSKVLTATIEERATPSEPSPLVLSTAHVQSEDLSTQPENMNLSAFYAMVSMKIPVQ